MILALILATVTQLPSSVLPQEPLKTVSYRDNLRPRETKNVPMAAILSSATLVLVPSNLLGQWSQEIHKHCDDSLRHFVQLDNNSVLPKAQDLASAYDVRVSDLYSVGCLC